MNREYLVRLNRMKFLKDVRLKEKREPLTHLNL